MKITLNMMYKIMLMSAMLSVLFMCSAYADSHQLVGQGDKIVMSDHTEGDSLLEFVSSVLWSRVQDMIIEDEYIYCAMATGIQIYKLSNDYSIEFVSQVHIQNGTSSLAKEHNYIFVAGKKCGMYIIDISAIESPKIIGKYKSESKYATIEVDNNLVYLSRNNCIEILNIENLIHPEYFNIYCLDSGRIEANKIVVRGNYAYVVGSALYVLDVRNPKDIQLVTRYEYSSSGSAIDIRIEGEYAYIAYDRNELFSMYSYIVKLDISNPSNPEPLASFRYQGDCENISVSKHFVFVSAGLSGLLILDKSTPDTLRLVGCHRETGYLTLETGTVGNSLIIAQTSSFPTSANDKVYDVCNETPILENEFDGLKDHLVVLDLYNIESPQVICGISDPNIPHKIMVSGSYAYVAEMSGGLSVLDVSIANSIQLLSYIDLPNSIFGGHTIGLCKKDDIVYISAAEKGVYFVDVSNAYSPKLIYHLSVAGIAYDVITIEDYLYIADGLYGIHIVNISNPNHPIFINSIPIIGMALEFEVNDNILYLAANSGGFRIYDVSDRESPVLISYILTGSYLVHNIAVDNNYAIASGVGKACYIVDTKDIHNLEFKKKIPLDDIVYDLEIKNNILFIANAYSGLSVYRIGDSLEYEFYQNIQVPYYSIDIEISNCNLFLSNYTSVTIFSLMPINQEDPIISCYMYQNYPNPFNTTTIIPFAITQDSQISLDIYNILGQHVTNLASGYYTSGKYRVVWDGLDKIGDKVASGIYFCVLKNNNREQLKKMLYMK